MSKRGVFSDLWRTRMVRLWTIGVVGLLILLVILLIIVRPDQKTDQTIPQTIVKLANFTPYFYKGALPADFKTDPGTTSYNAGVLFVRLINKDKKSVIITQQAAPQSLRDSKVQGTEDIDGAPGSAALTYKEGRTTGTLITYDKTMIIVTSADGVESSVIKDLVRFLKPVR